MLIGVLLFSIFFLVLSVRRIEWAVAFLLFALPSYLIRFKIFGIPSTILEVMILVVFTVWFFQNKSWILGNLKQKFSIQRSAFRIRRYPFDIEMVLVLVIAFISVGVAGFSNSAFGIFKAYFFEPLLMYIVIFNVILNGAERSEESRTIKTGSFAFAQDDKFKIIIFPLLLSASIVSLLAIYQKFTGNLIDNPLWAAESTRRVVSVFGYPNAVALYLGPLLMLFLGWVFSFVIPAEAGIQKKADLKIFNSQFSIFNKFSIFNFQTILIFLVIILSFLSIIFAKSIGGILGVVAGLIVFGILVSRKSRITTIGILIFASICVISFASIRVQALKYVTLNDFSGQVRKVGWEEAWSMLKDGRLLFGAGLANFQNAVKPYHLGGFFYNKDNDPNFHRLTVFNEEYRKAHWQPLEIYMYPHNIFLNFWSELGLAGMLVFIWIIIKFYILGIKLIINYQLSIINKYFVIGLLSAMTVIIVHGLVDVPYFKNDLSIMFWVLIYLMGVINLENKKGESN